MSRSGVQLVEVGPVNHEWVRVVERSAAMLAGWNTPNGWQLAALLAQLNSDVQKYREGPRS